MIGILANGTRPIKGNLIELKGTTSRSAWVISFCYFGVRRDTCSAFLPLSVYKHTTFSYHLCWSLPTDKVQREEAIVDCFQNTSRQSLTLWPFFLRSITTCSYLRLCQVPQVWSVSRLPMFSTGKEVKGEESILNKKKLANFGCPSNFVTWLQLKLVHISQNECKSAFRLNFCILTELIMFLMYT